MSKRQTAVEWLVGIMSKQSVDDWLLKIVYFHLIWVIFILVIIFWIEAFYFIWSLL
jgi:hypothetical protein